MTLVDGVLTLDGVEIFPISAVMVEDPAQQPDRPAPPGDARRVRHPAGMPAHGSTITDPRGSPSWASSKVPEAVCPACWCRCCAPRGSTSGSVRADGPAVARRQTRSSPDSPSAAAQQRHPPGRRRLSATDRAAVDHRRHQSRLRRAVPAVHRRPDRGVVRAPTTSAVEPVIADLIGEHQRPAG